MKKSFIFLILTAIIATLLASCTNNKMQNISQRIHNAREPNRVTLYCFGDFSRKKAMRLVNNLKAFYPNVELADESIPLPSDQYYKPRNRYKGTGLFNELFARRDGNAIIGLTNYVIYAPNNISTTYGVMGIAPTGKYICVVSNKIPKGGTQNDENLCKLALHELGHAFGLPHCPDQHCYMVDAEHRYKLPQSNNFCPSCKEFLNIKGWRIK